jgi:gamma-glutamyltranspeptidase/glutathione hydrolase
MTQLASYSPPSHTAQTWHVTKPAARGRRGIVVSQARAAAEVGVAVLEAGGNAVDAAVAAGFALATVEPWNSGLGGIGFALVHPAGAARAETVDFGPVAPAAIDPARFRLTGNPTSTGFAWPEVEGDINIRGPLSVAIPSTVEGYRAMHARWGRLPIAELLGPAIALARRGLPLDWYATVVIAQAAAGLRQFAESARLYLPDGLPPTPPYRGDPAFLVQGKLVATLEHLRSAGLRDFYEGEIAAALVADMAEAGGVLSADDLRRCQARFRPAGEMQWRGRTLQYADGLTAGPTFARVLAALPAAAAAAPDAAWFAALARALLAAYAARLDGEGAAASADAGCTTHLTVCDAEGGMVALTSTLMSAMGSDLVLPRTGVLLNNGIMWFDPRPGRPNSIAPGRRPLTNMCPVILRDGTAPVLAAGASGGRRIMAAVLQATSFVADFGMDPAAAAHHPRIDVSGTDAILADRRLGEDVLAALRAVAPTATAEQVAQPINFACPNLILARPDGERVGISDAMSPWSAALAEPDHPTTPSATR